jgi:hypothetical protein
MELRIEFSGDVVERSELLNGTQSVDIEGADTAGEWSVVGSFSWNRGLLDYAGEGDATLTSDDGGEIFATLQRAHVTEPTDEGTSFVVDYEVDGGSGAFEDARGTARAEGTLAGDTFRGVWIIQFETQ